MPEGTTEEVVEEVIVPTALDELNGKIQTLRDRLAKEKNAWDQYALDALLKEAATSFDPDGEYLPDEAATSDVTVQLSPPEVVNATGYWNVQPRAFDILPDWIQKLEIDPSIGLNISVSRSNGCVQIQNQVETSALWIADSETIAANYGVSARSIKMAGYAMAGWRYLLPAMDWLSPFAWDNYSVQPEVPFNTAEKQLWQRNWSRFQFSGGALGGAKMQYSDLFVDPKDPATLIDLNNRHVIVTMANHPQHVVPGMMAMFNTGMFMYTRWRSAVNAAHQIDAGMASRVGNPGYSTVSITGKDKTAWYAANGEDTNKGRKPRFTL